MPGSPTTWYEDHGRCQITPAGNGLRPKLIPYSHKTVHTNLELNVWLAVLPGAPLRRESQHVGDASGEEMATLLAEFPTALWCTGPPVKDKRFLISLHLGKHAHLYRHHQDEHLKVSAFAAHTTSSSCTGSAQVGSGV